MKQEITKFKDPLCIRTWLSTALNKEKEKFNRCPVVADFVPDIEHAQAWAYVNSSYLLLEQSFKALLYINHDRTIPSKTHSLVPLFSKLDSNYASVLSEFFRDFKFNHNNPKMRLFPFSDLRAFLANLDGDQNKKGQFVGSFDWRYFLIEETPNNRLPLVSIDYMHEVVFGCIRIIEHAINGWFDPIHYTLSRRLHMKRWDDKYFDWLTVRMNSGDWEERPDTIEILLGPDTEERFDLLFPMRSRLVFDKIPHSKDLKIVDRREEINQFDPDQELERIGIYRNL